MKARGAWLVTLLFACSLLIAGPARGATEAVPASACKATSDSAATLESFLASVPNGSTVVFPSGGSCMVALDLDLSVPPSGMTQRAGTVYDLNGATIFRTVEPSCTKPSDCNSPLMRLQKVSGVTLKNGAIHSVYDPGPTPRYDSTRAKNHAVVVHGSSGVTLSGLTIRNMGGDCVDVDKLGKVPSTGIAFTGTADTPTTCHGVGRQGISANATDGLTVSGVRFDYIGRSAVDIEPRLSWHARTCRSWETPSAGW